MSLEKYFRGETVSNEGFFDSLKRLLSSKKDSEIKEAYEKDQPAWKLIQWVSDEMPQLVDAYTGERESVTLPLRHSPFFVNGTTPIADLSKAIAADIKAYQAMFKKAQPALKKAVDHYNTTDRELDKFAGNVDHPEEFTKALAKAVATQPPGLLASFIEPTHSFMGFGRDPFADKDAFVYQSYPDKVKAPVTLPAMDKATFTQFAKTLAAACELHFEIEMYCDDIPVGMDGTDAPIRGYLDWDEVTDLINKANFVGDTFSDLNKNLLYNILDRLGKLISAMVAFVKESV